MKPNYQEIQKQLDTLKAENNKLKTENKKLKDLIKSYENDKYQDADLYKANFLFSTIMDYIPLRIYFKNNKSEFTLVNKHVARKHGCNSPDELIGKTDFDFFSKDIAQKFYEDEQKIINTGIPMIDYIDREIWANGKITWSSTSKVPLRNDKNQIIGILGVTKDITEQKNAETALLENEKYLTKLNQTKDKFFSVIAHDLKSPFNSILGFSKLLSSNWDSLEEKEKKHYINIIHNSAENTYKLLENLLIWARTQLETISFNPQKLDMNLLFEETIQVLHHIAEDKSININNLVPKNTYVYADKDMVSTVIRNLLGNALKFTASDGKINISHKTDTANNKTFFSLKDNGIGIPKENIDKLFDLSENISTLGLNNEKGTGLGLVLCKEFIETHGGSIYVESEPGKGSTFIFSLPSSSSKL